MAKGYGEKLKILYLRDFLLRSSDEEHPVTIKDIQDALAEHYIEAERKSLYRDLKILGCFTDRERKLADDPDYIDDSDKLLPEDSYNMDIVRKKDRYYVRSRDFTLEEVKILVDMVQSSNFITQGKTEELIKKLETLCSVHEAKTLHRDVRVRNRVKVMNDSVFINVDRISGAINEDRVLSFQYFSYDVNKKKALRHDGEKYVVSPLALIWVDQNYYLLGYSHKYEEIRPYRVDRMTNVRSSKGPRRGKDAFERIDIATFTTKVFHMYLGDIKMVRMRFHRGLADSVIDRFGESVMLIPDGEDHFTVTTEVAVSPQFYGWVAGFGNLAEVLGPEPVREGMRKHLAGSLELYK